MNEQATRLETTESNLIQLMADVSRAMEKAQHAIARVTSTVGAATAGTESIEAPSFDCCRGALARPILSTPATHSAPIPACSPLPQAFSHDDMSPQQWREDVDQQARASGRV